MISFIPRYGEVYTIKGVESEHSLEIVGGNHVSFCRYEYCKARHLLNHANLGNYILILPLFLSPENKDYLHKVYQRGCPGNPSPLDHLEDSVGLLPELFSRIWIGLLRKPVYQNIRVQENPNTFHNRFPSAFSGIRCLFLLRGPRLQKLREVRLPLLSLASLPRIPDFS